MLRPLVVVGALLAAGCVSPLQSAGTEAPAADASTILAQLAAALEAVPCEASSVGADTSDNLKLLSVLGFENGGRAELDPWNGWLVAGSGNGLDFIDARDPLAPRLAHTLNDEEGYGDAKWLANGSAVVVARWDARVEIVGVEWVGGEPIARSLGAWDYPLPGPGHFFTNMHMLESHTVAGEHYFFVAPNDDTGVWMVRVLFGEDEVSFEPLPPLGAPFNGGPLGPHDMTVEDDLLLEKPILYVANGFEGWQAFDISDPDAPARLAVLPNLDPGQGYVHTIAGNLVGDRRIVATISEVGVNMLKIFDATDFARPIPLALWWADRAQPQSPQHDITILGDKLYMAHYTHGVYVFDLAKLGSAPLADTATISPVAHFAPANRMDPGALGFANVFDVVVMNGILYVSDFTDAENAVTTLGYGCLAPGDARLTAG